MTTEEAGAAKWRAGAEGSIRQLTRGLADAGDIPDVLRRITDLARERAEADSAHLEHVLRGANEVEVVAASGDTAVRIGARIPYPGSLAEDVLERREPQVLTAEELRKRPVAGLLGVACDPCTILVVPIISESEALGALVLMRPVERSAFTPAEVERLQVLAHLAALAVRRAQLGDRLHDTVSDLVASERRFRLLVESVKEYAIFMLDPHGRVSSWNRGAQRISGYEESEIVGEHFSRFYTGEDRARHHPEAELRTAERDGSYEEEGWRVRKDGSRYWAHVTITAMRDPERRLVGFAKVTRDLSERKAAMDRLAESEERFRQLAENAREVFWLFNPDMSEALYISPAYEQVWGRPAEDYDAGAEAWRRSVVQEDRERLRGFSERIRERETTIEYRIVRADGAVRWLWSRGFPIRDASGALIRIGGVTEDVTAEKEAEERLRFLAEAGRALNASLDYEQTLRNVARLAVSRVADWCVVDILEDEQILRLGVAHRDPEKEALAWEVTRRYPPDPNALAGVAEALRTGKPLVYDISPEMLERVSRDEEHRRLLEELGLCGSMIVPMIAHGRTLGAITFITAESRRSFGEEDLPFAQEIASRAALAIDNARLYREAEASRGEAERRARQEAALRRAAEAVTASFETDQVIWEIARNSLEATNADGAFVKRIHLEEGEVEVVAVAGERVPPIGARASYAGSYAQRIFETGGPLLVPSLGAEHDGVPAREMMRNCADCSAMVVPLIDAGEAIGTLVLTRLPEKQGFRHDEMERARTFADLASMAFRKIHLLQDSEQRREELETVMESRTRLIRGFTHDLKNPLGAADGYLDLVETGVVTDPERVELSVSRARRAIRSALGLIHDLTELALAESGQIEVHLAPIDVRIIAWEMAEEYRAQAEAKGLAIRCEAPRELAVTLSDASRIRQVLGNLISNAVKYTDGGGVEVRVKTVSEGAGAWIAIGVRDTGPGIPQERQHLLFREFSRLEPMRAPGAGLGLAISQRIAEALDGRITVESQVGTGSEFALWIPVRSG
jgi:PAS domain S-box-containing protein